MYGPAVHCKLNFRIESLVSRQCWIKRSVGAGDETSVQTRPEYGDNGQGAVQAVRETDGDILCVLTGAAGSLCVYQARLFVIQPGDSDGDTVSLNGWRLAASSWSHIAAHSGTKSRLDFAQNQEKVALERLSRKNSSIGHFAWGRR
jgi:hypothetical protein